MRAITDALVDPEVSRSKFEREIADYRGLGDAHIRKGCWMIRAEFPEVFMIFGTPHLKPPVVIFGALLDFTNYDLWPPSVKLVNPFSRLPYKWDELPTHMLRRVVSRPPTNTPEAAADGQPTPTGTAPTEEVSIQPMMMPNPPDGEPFLCLPGTRAYHDHPSHSGDSWLLHRGQGEGKLFHLLNTLYTYGAMPAMFGVQLVVPLQRVPE